MARINRKITIRPIYFVMLLLSAAVIVLAVRLTATSDLNSLKAAAEQGDVDAQFDLGYMYANGEGVSENGTEAVRWYRMAAEQGDAAAQHNLGLMYDTGEGIPKNPAEAVRLYRMAAEREMPLRRPIWVSCISTTEAFPRITYRPMPGIT